ncbi:MAG: NAD(P)H-dependent oxidoreductase [Spirochaetaceae bacterium]|nr:MAG: NAD(P)H-dependent oxidoreductase [Spirochaetaceae bacterium]
MVVLGIVGSMRKNRCTNTLVNEVITALKERNPRATEKIIHTADMGIQPCRVICSSYCIQHPYCCSIDDEMADVLASMTEADALVIGTPLYFRAPPAQFQAFAERLISMFFFQESKGSGNSRSPLTGKPCGLIGVAEYSNPQRILEYLHDFCTVLGMHPVLLERFPYLGVAAQGEIEMDTTFQPLERAKDLAAAISASL